ncbi:Branched-chain-amino-acid aminotransferase [compost metagenome]
MNNIIAKRELLASGASPGAEGMMLSGDGWLAEGVVSNLFFAKAGIVYTPSIDTGILPGITRERVMELARLEGLTVIEGKYSWAQLMDADEVWLTNSIQELVPVCALTDSDGMQTVVSGGKAGVMTRQLLTLYRRDTL